MRGRPMRYRITYHPDMEREPELVEADSVAVEGGTQIVLRGATVVIGQPREIVIRRLRAAEVEAVDAV